MGNLINLAVRKGGKVKTALSNTSIITQLFNPELYEGNNKALRDLLATCYAQAPEDMPGAAQLAPFDNGLIVLDCDRKTVFSLQGLCDVASTSIAKQSRPWEHILELGKRGWLGGKLYNTTTSDALIDLPMDMFSSVDALKKWAWTTNVDYIQSAQGRPPIAGFRLQPPEWTISAYNNTEAASLRNTLTSIGFDIPAEALAGWESWATPPQQ